MSILRKVVLSKVQFENTFVTSQEMLFRIRKYA